jgi:hypothetical protein
VIKSHSNATRPYRIPSLILRKADSSIVDADAAAIYRILLRTLSKKKDKNAKNPNEGKKSAKRNKKVG